jgi:hypothetical protein
MAAIAMVLVAAIALSSATYAWFVNNSSVVAQSATVKATTSKLLLISSDNEKYGTSTDLGITLTNMTPVSAGANLIKTGKFYKVNGWASGTADSKTNPYGALASTYTVASGTQGTANATTGTTQTGDYAYQTIYLKSDVAGAKIYFNNTTTEISASTDVVVTTTETVELEGVKTEKTTNTTYTVKATYKNGTTTTEVLTGGKTTTDSNDAITTAKTKVQNAIGALRVAIVPYSSTGSDGTADTPIVLTNSTTSTNGYYNTESSTASTNITANQVVKEVSSSTAKATLETDPAAAFSTYTATVSGETVTTTSKTALTTLTNADTAYKYMAYIYIEGCDRDCVSTIAADVTYNVQLGFTQSTTN